MEAKQTYFSALNYSLANEDTSLELSLCRQTKPRRILSVCGSGGRFLPLLAAQPATVVALDLATAQLHLAALRRATIKHLAYDDFLLFWGFAPYGVDAHRARRQELFEQLPLEAVAREAMREVLEATAYRGLIYEGKWEKTITAIPQALRRIVGSYYDKVFECRSLKEQSGFMSKNLASFWWKLVPRLVLLIFGNAAFFNAFLYRGNFAKKNIEGSYYSFYRKAFRSLFERGLARENFFLQLCFYGYIAHAEGNPIEADPEVFQAMQAALRSGSSIELYQGDIIDFAGKASEKFDFVSLSDVPSYFTGERERNYLQSLRGCLNPGALVVVRCYLRVPESTNLSGYSDVSDLYADAIAAEKTQMYRVFVYQYQGGLS